MDSIGAPLYFPSSMPVDSFSNVNQISIDTFFTHGELRKEKNFTPSPGAVSERRMSNGWLDATDYFSSLDYSYPHRLVRDKGPGSSALHAELSPEVQNSRLYRRGLCLNVKRWIPTSL